MERKIGEIFEYNGEWYQCVESKQNACTDCAFNPINGIGYNCSGSCTYKQVIFKKLEKVGEPYDDCGTILQRFKIYTNVTNADTKGLELHIYSNNTIGIEIKQIKEDMEQEIEYFGDENNNAKHSNPESIGKNLKEFDLKAAKQGKPVCTRDGRKARIICFDAKGEHPIIALVTDGVQESPYNYTKEGYYHTEGVETMADLMMLPEKKEGWVNVYKERIYSTKEEAIEATYDGVTYVDTVKVSWEE